MLHPDIPLALTFDDVLLVPRASDVLPRDVEVGTRLGSVELNIPLLSAAMDTVTEGRLAAAIATHGGLGVIHKNLTIEQQVHEVRHVKLADVVEPNLRHAGAAATDDDGRLVVGAAIGVGGDRDTRAAALVGAGADLLTIDTAHGHSAGVLDAVRAVKDRHPEVTLVAGNVATPEATAACFAAGADVVKVGVGPGSICTTRVVAGTGVPQLTAVAGAAEVARELGRQIVSDGGVRSSGDLAKAIAAGADAIMIGSMFAGTDEAPGTIMRVGDRRYKSYRGMGSMEAMSDGSADRYFQERGGDPLAMVRKLVPEGVVARVPLRGPVDDVIYMLVGGLRAAMGYSGCADLGAMHRDARFVRITSNGLSESHVHDVDMLEEAPNYSRR